MVSELFLLDVVDVEGGHDMRADIRVVVSPCAVQTDIIRDVQKAVG